MVIPSYMMLFHYIILENILTSRPTSTMRDEQIGYSLCEQAKIHLHSFFINLQTRKISPSQLDDVQNAGELSKTLQIVGDFLTLKLFKDHKVTRGDLEKELRSYHSFTERNRKLLNFAHIFTEFSEGT